MVGCYPRMTLTVNNHNVQEVQMQTLKILYKIWGSPMRWCYKANLDNNKLLQLYI